MLMIGVACGLEKWRTNRDGEWMVFLKTSHKISLAKMYHLAQRAIQLTADAKHDCQSVLYSVWSPTICIMTQSMIVCSVVFLINRSVRIERRLQLLTTCTG